MGEIIDPIYFRELEEQDPDDVCRRTLCRYDRKKKAYILRAWGEDYVIQADQGQIYPIRDGAQVPHDYLLLFMIYYLVKGKEIEIRNEWISEKDIPGGATFFRGPHEIPTNLITRSYENDIERFRKRCLQLRGTDLDMGDAAYCFSMAPRIPVAVMYWKGDDEFPPEAKILYDRTINEHLTSDIIYTLAVHTCRKIGDTSGE